MEQHFTQFKNRLEPFKYAPEFLALANQLNTDLEYKDQGVKNSKKKQYHRYKNDYTNKFLNGTLVSKMENQHQLTQLQKGKLESPMEEISGPTNQDDRYQEPAPDMKIIITTVIGHHRNHGNLKRIARMGWNGRGGRYYFANNYRNQGRSPGPAYYRHVQDMETELQDIFYRGVETRKDPHTDGQRGIEKKKPHRKRGC